MTIFLCHVTIVRDQGDKMDRIVWLVTPEEDFEIGKVKDALRNKCQRRISQAVRDIVDELVFDVDSKDYAVITIELR